MLLKMKHQTVRDVLSLWCLVEIGTSAIRYSHITNWKEAIQYRPFTNQTARANVNSGGGNIQRRK
jgi:hypothetical protein